MKIIKATVKDIPLVAPLFDQYRIFYKQGSDLDGAQDFLTARLGKNESVIFIAIKDGNAIGFTQLFPAFSSVAMQAIYILNDLYVDREFRKLGIGESLLEKAKEYCMAQGCKGLALETAIDNPAQQLYERLGWKRDTHCFHYFWTAP